MERKAIVKNKWVTLYTGFQMPTFRISPASYFDSRWYIILSLGYGIMYLHLPIYSKIDECEYPEYGFYFYGEGRKVFDTFVWCWRRKTYHFYMPWSLTWYRTSYFLKDETWANFIKKQDYKQQDKIKEGDQIFKEKHPYTYTLKNGTIQNRIATNSLVEREWRMKWFKFTKLGGIINRMVEVEFSDEVGERTGSWKGGTIGCSYRVTGREKPIETLRRMEKERKF